MPAVNPYAPRYGPMKEVGETYNVPVSAEAERKMLCTLNQFVACDLYC